MPEKKILVIDDETPIRSMLKKILEREDFIVIVAANGSDGLRKALDQPPDLVITDLLMPEKEGLETILELKRCAPQIPVVAMSGGGLNDPAGYLQTAKLFGADAVMEKPVNKKTLLKIIDDTLQTQI